MQSKETQALIDKYANMQRDIFDILIKQLKQTNMSEITANNVLQWQLEALSKTGVLTKEVVKAVARVNKATPKDVENLASKLGLQAVSDVQSEIKQHTNMKGDLTPDVGAMIEAYAKPMQKSLTKVVNEGLIDRNTRTNAVAQVYKDIVNRTTLEVMSGLKTHEQAVRDNVYRWVDKGIPTKLTDRAGKGWSLEGYSRTVITTATRQEFNELRKETMSVNDVHLAKMSWHACAREACAPIQGHVVSSLPPTDPRYDPKYPSIFDYGYGEPSGTLGINCGHIFTPWDPDVNIDHQSEDMPTPEEAVKQGKVQQKQRQQERAIRQTKKLLDTAEKLGDSDKVASLKKRLSRQQGKLRGLIKENSFLSRDYKRERIFNKPEQYKALPRLKLKSKVVEFKSDNMREVFGDENYNAFLGKINSPDFDPAVKGIFNKYQDRFKFIIDGSHPHFDPSNGTVYLNTGVFTGGNGKRPLETVFHEMGHAVDEFATKDILGESIVKTGRKVKMRIGRKTLKDDEWTSKVSSSEKYNFSRFITNDLRNTVFKDTKILDNLKEKVQESDIIKANYSSLSDILESTGALGVGEHPLGFGHGKRYWKKGTGMQETEFFAEMTESMINPEMLEIQKKYFPTASKKYFELVNIILKGG